MGKTKKFGGRKTGPKCPICHRVFSGERYLNQHLESGHGIASNNNKNNNNKKIIKKNKFNKNKNILRKFIIFIIKLVSLINEQFDIKNYIGDDFEQRKAQYNLNNNIEVPMNNSDVRDKVIATLDDGDIYERYERVMEGIPKKKIEVKQKSKEEEEDEVINYLKKLNKKRGIEEEEADEEEINNLKKIGEEIKNTKIKYNDIKYLKNINKDIFKEALLDYEQNEIKVFNEHMVKWEPYLEEFGEFFYVKISVLQLFKEVIPNELKTFDWVKKQIIHKFHKKKKTDYPDDFLLARWSPKTYDAILKARAKNTKYAEAFLKIKQIIINFFDGEANDYQCDDCRKFVINKKRHCLHCPEFKKKLEEEGQKKLKKFIEENYKNINLLDVDQILEEFKEKNVDYICENLPRVTKFWKKIKKNKIEKTERTRANRIFKGRLAATKANWKKMIGQIKRECSLYVEKRMKSSEKIK